MKRFVFLLTLLATVGSILSAQNRAQARGAEPGELYLNDPWYGIYDPDWGPGFYGTLRMAIYHLTENGKKLTIQYDADYFGNPETTMIQGYILADATPGVLYARCYYLKNNDLHTSLWVSFDYGEHWTFREENIGNLSYFSTNVDGLIYKGGVSSMGEAYKSIDYGINFDILETNFIVGEPGFNSEEFLFIGGSTAYQYELWHTYDLYLTWTEIPIDGEYVYGQTSQAFPDVYRGGKEGEMYISSWFPDHTYKISFSADTGNSFRHVYISDVYPPGGTFYPKFMSDREPGVFYIIQRYEVEDLDPWGHHTRICIDYYREYGEILEATFCHDLTQDYEYEEVMCEHTTDLEAEVNLNSIQLQWTNSADNIRGYHVYRNDTRITSELLVDAIYLDENLPNGEYEYYVRAYYEEDCVSDSSNHVIGIIDVENCDYMIDLVSEIVNQNSVQLHWTHSADDLLIEGYHLYRNQSLITNELLTETTYLDEDLPNGMLQYFVIAYFTNDCDSIVSNIVEETIETEGIEAPPSPPEGGDVRVYPNPTTGELKITNYAQQPRHAELVSASPANEGIAGQARNDVKNVEIFDIFGRNVLSVPPPLRGGLGGLDISFLPAGIYFLRIQTETGTVTKKVITN